MAAVLHGSARTTPRVRAELQAAKGGTPSLAARYVLNPKTVAKWRKRASTADAPMGPTRPRSTNLTEAEEVASVMCGCLLRVKVFGRGGGTESTGAVMCPASNAAGMAAGPDELRGASA
jgi:hypothetical protein